MMLLLPVSVMSSAVMVIADCNHERCDNSEHRLSASEASGREVHDVAQLVLLLFIYYDRIHTNTVLLMTVTICIMVVCYDSSDCQVVK